VELNGSTSPPGSLAGGISISDCPVVSMDGCTVSQNTGDGITLGNNSSVKGSTANQNGGKGIIVGDNSMVADCTSSNNPSDGIIAGDRTWRKSAYALREMLK
jgi:parallel beta-helix repeat protein